MLHTFNPSTFSGRGRGRGRGRSRGSSRGRGRGWGRGRGRHIFVIQWKPILQSEF